MAQDINGAEITITETPASTPTPHKLSAEWDAASTPDKKLTVIAKALGIIV